MNSRKISTKGRPHNATGRSAIVAAVGAVATAILLFMPHIRDGWRSADTDIEDRLLRMTPGAEIRDDLVFLGIDERSLNLEVGEDLIAENPVLAMMKARFPWDRRVYAAAIERLLDGGARLVVLDFALSEPSVPEADAALAETIARYRDRVVLTCVFAPVASQNNEFKLSDPMDEFLGDGPDWTRCGYANFRPDRDGIVRAAKYTTTLSAENNRPIRADEPVFNSLAAEIIAAMGKPVPEGRRNLRFAKRDDGTAHDVYEPIPIFEIFDPQTWQHRYQSGAAFRDKVVMIGPAAPRFQDEHQTPVGLLAGPQLHLQAVTAGLEESFVTRLHPAAIWMSAAGVLCVWLIARISRHPWIAIACAVGAMGAVALGAYALGATSEYLTGFTTFMLVISAGTVSGQTHALVTERLERGRLHKEFRRFVSRDVADTLVNQPELYQQAAMGRKRCLAVLFSDVRGFTGRSETDDPAKLVGQLNEYFSAMVAVVFRNGGTLDKFIGDAVMAHWGALDDGKDDATRASNAISAAREMISELEVLNTRWSAKGLEPYHIGVGLHLGEAVAGEIGSLDRTEFAVIGDAVNLASRTEGLCKHFHTDFLCTDAVAKAAGFPKTLRRLASVRVSGRQEPVGIWSPVIDEINDAIYAAALETFEQGHFGKAAEIFASLPEDGPARRLHEWAAEFAKNPPADWDGVISMSGK